MRRIVLTAALALAGLISANNVNAQSFTMAHDTIKATVWGPTVLSNDITNNTSLPINISWHVIYHNLPTSWQVEAGICDNINCYSNNILGTSSTPNTPPFTPPGVGKTSDTFSSHMEMHMQAELSGVTAGGPYYVSIELVNGATKDTMTFEMQKWPTSVNTTSSKQDVTVYPNPASDEVNVVFDANSGIKTISIRNIIGKVVGNYKVTGNSAKLNISNLQSGIYFLNLADAQGRIIAIKKFTAN